MSNKNNQKVELLFSAAEIATRNQALAQEIAQDHGNGLGAGNGLLVVPILKGSFVFAADLLRELHHQGISPQVDFLYLSSYMNATSSSGKVELRHDIRLDPAGRDVLIIDDILESGRTLDFARRLMQQRGAVKTSLCVFLDKQVERAPGIELEADYAAFSCPDLFVVGYGMDLAQNYRQLPYVGHIPQAEK